MAVEPLYDSLGSIAVSSQQIDGMPGPREGEASDQLIWLCFRRFADCNPLSPCVHASVTAGTPKGIRTGKQSASLGEQTHAAGDRGQPKPEVGDRFCISVISCRNHRCPKCGSFLR